MGEWWQTRDDRLAKRLPKGTSQKSMKWWQNKDTKGMKKSFEAIKEAIRFKAKDPGERSALAKGIGVMRRTSRSKWQGTDVVRGARKGLAAVVKAGGGSGSRYESVPRIFSSLAVTEALERAKESLECGCIDKLEWAAEALAMAMCEAGCPPLQHINQKLGRCAPIPGDISQAMKKAHEVSTKARKPEDHEMAHKKMTDVAVQLHGAGFHHLAGLHAARAHGHGLAAAN